jgi:basic amino acid/polyamine antiporter, APA family
VADTPTAPKATLGLTGLTSNAMALIAPGAFLWLTMAMQCLYGAPMAGSDIWFGIVVALLLCFATAISYAELSKLYPGAGSSYFFAEQAFLSKSKAFRYARLAKFMVGWASHLYYWVYPGVMVGVTGLIAGYMLGQLFPSFLNPAIPAPMFMAVFCVFFAFGVAYIAFRGVGGTTAVNAAINVIQISALVVFSVMAIGYRLNHGPNSIGHVIAAMDGKTSKGEAIVAGMASDMKQDQDKDGNNLFMDAKGVATTQAATADGKTQFDPKMVPATLDDYKSPIANVGSKDDKNPETRAYFANAADVVKPHGFSFSIIQACIAILILVGFESVTSMGEEAKNAKRDIPRAVLLSLFIQGFVCYLLEYFAAKFFMNSNYPIASAGGSVAPVGDMMQMVGMYFFGSAKAGWWFMMIQGVTVFLALIGTTLSCLSTGARVTYAMGRDAEVPEHFGLLHGNKLTPHRAIWMLAAISAVIGVICVFFNFCGGAAQANTALQSCPDNLWYKFGLMENSLAAKVPQGLLVMTLVSNFGTFLLYMMTCIVAIVAFREHHMFNGIKHMLIPVFGLLANLACMIFYLVGPFSVNNMRWQEPYVALGIAAAWGIYGAIYFLRNSKKTGKPVFVEKSAVAASPVTA